MARSHDGLRVPEMYAVCTFASERNEKNEWKNDVRSGSSCLAEHCLTPGCVLVIKRKLQGCYSVLFLCHRVRVLHFNFNSVPSVWLTPIQSLIMTNEVDRRPQTRRKRASEGWNKYKSGNSFMRITRGRQIFFPFRFPLSAVQGRLFNSRASWFHSARQNRRALRKRSFLFSSCPRCTNRSCSLGGYGSDLNF